MLYIENHWPNSTFFGDEDGGQQKKKKRFDYASGTVHLSAENEIGSK